MATKRDDGRYQKSFTYDGKRYYVYSSKKANLDQKIADKIQELKTSKVSRANPTLQSYYDDFIDLKKDIVKPSTIRNYQKWFKIIGNMSVNDVKLKDIRIRDIKTKDIKIIQKALIDNGKYSTRTINDCRNHLKHVFNEAINDEILDKNPCKSISDIKRKEPEATKTKHRALSIDETKEFIKVAINRDSFYVNHFKLMLQTGMRMGELGALTLSDIDFTAQTISIDKTVSRDELGAYIVNPTPKTDASTRIIPMNDMAVQTIKDQRRLLAKTFGLKFNRLLFPSSKGELLRDYTYNREIKRVTDDMGIAKITSHAFRTTFATRFIEERPHDYKILSEILGHSDIKITLNLYAQVMKENKQKSMEKFTVAM